MVVRATRYRGDGVGHAWLILVPAVQGPQMVHRTGPVCSQR
jgi:hypothetical protein